MKKTLKRLLSILLCIILMFGTITVGGEETSNLFKNFFIDVSALESTGNSKIDAFINDGRYTNGVYWPWDKQATNYQGYDCCSYCSAYTEYCYGNNNPRSGEIFYDAWNIRAGDVLTLGNPSDGSGHWLICLKRSGNKLYVAEGNFSSKVRIGWNYTISSGCYFQEDSRVFIAGYHYLPEHTCDYNASVKITKAPTKTTTGTRTKTCSCGKSITQTIPAIPYTTDLKEGIYTVSTKCNSNLKLATNSSCNYNVYVFEYNNNYSDEFWLFRKNEDGTYTIENAYYNGYCLDVNGGSMLNDANVQSYSNNGSDAQKFYVVPDGNYYKLVNKGSYLNVDNYCAGTSSGNNVIQYEDNGNDAQKWILNLANPKVSTSASSVEVSSGSSKTVTCTVSRKTQGIIMTSLIGDSNVCSTSWGNWDGMNIPITITGKSGGSTWITITLKDKDTGIVYDTNTFKISVPDTTKPKCSISTTNNVATFQNVKLSFSDDIGLTGYYWGTSSTYSNNTYYYTSGKSNSVATTVSSAGTYYLTAKDTYGNISSTASKTFYKTTLNANGGSVSTAYVITASGNSFTLPTPTRSGYTFKGWNIYSGGTVTSYSGTYKPTSSITLYAQWASNHTHSYTKTVTPPTCTTQGYTTYTCSCGSSYKTDYVKAKGHTEGEWVITKPATFTETGIKTLYCKECGKVIKTEIIPVITGKVVSATVNNIEVKYKNTATVNTEINTEGDVEYTVKYETSNPKVATVDNDGNITTYGKGTAEITCTVTDEYDNKVEDTCTVTVKFSFGQWLIWIFLLGFLWY